MKEKGVLHNDDHAAHLLRLTCDTLLFLRNDGMCVDMIVKTENNPYVNDQCTLLGKNIFEVFPEETVRELKPAVDYVVRTGDVANANYDLPAEDELYFFKCIIHKYDDEHVLCQYRDITRRSQMKRQLQTMNERLVETERAAKIGYWSYDTATQILNYSGYIGILAKENEKVVIPFDEYMEYVYVEDRVKLDVLLGENGKASDILEFRIVKDEQLYYLRLKVLNRYFVGDALRLDGYVQNINDIVSKWNELKMVTLAVNNSNDSIYATKVDGTLIFANRLCRTHNMIPEDSDISRSKVYEVLRNYKDKYVWEEFVDALRANGNSLKYVCNYPYPQLDIIASDCSSFIIYNEYGEEIIWHFRRDISEQIRYERALKKAKEKAEESDRLKSAFLSNMSHEIRTPLNAIVGFSAIMADIDNQEERKQYLNIIESSNKRLLMLINEVLDLSKIEAGTLEFDLTPVNLSDLCKEILMTHRLYAGHVTLELELPEKEVCIKTDNNRLTQVISNLMNNATKFTEKGTVTLGYRLIPHFVQFYVKDTGIGITKEDLPKIFNRFVKVDHFAPGTGLGLSICKTIVERLGGTISVESVEGKGSVFSFTIPLLPAIFESEKRRKDEDIRPIPQYKCRGEERALILVAEDMNDNFELIKAMIGARFRLLRAKDGREAMALAEEYEPDLILMDIKMPNVSGVEAIRGIRSKLSASTPIIAVSAYAFEEDKKELLDNGCNDFLPKPLDRHKLIMTINKYL